MGVLGVGGAGVAAATVGPTLGACFEAERVVRFAMVAGSAPFALKSLFWADAKEAFFDTLLISN